MIGVEGAHQTGNSLGALRMLFETGARYITLTHNCDNAIGTSWVSVNQKTGSDAGLMPFGRSFVREMNRLGMMVDLSHVSPQTMRDVLDVTRAPVIFSHSGAYGVENHLRNVPDDVLRSLRRNGGIVMLPAISVFMNSAHPEEATVEDVIDHILWIANVAGWDHVGLGSDFDGSTYIVKGLEVRGPFIRTHSAGYTDCLAKSSGVLQDVSQWPNMVSRLLSRGVTDRQAQMLVGNNLLRVWDEVNKVARVIHEEGELPSEESWENRLWEAENSDVPQLFTNHL
jgi:membrane dipeptidase